MAQLNANALLYGARGTPSYHEAIQLLEIKRKQLISADEEIRAELRCIANELVMRGRTMELATQKYRVTKQEPLPVEFKFLRQGSFVYGTAIEPAWTPPQQNDLDDGVYVRTSFVDHSEPGLAAKSLFAMIEKALGPLCDRRGWKLDREKTSCVRVELDGTKHIDLPLYAIPDEEFVALAHALQDAEGVELSELSKNLTGALSKWKQLRIDPDRVMLANRDGTWMRSDPRALHDRFEALVDNHGPQLRRQWRYLKGWRDFACDVRGPSSVCLMTAAANCYEQSDLRNRADRDDLVLLEVSRGIIPMFKGDIENPAVEGAPILNDWSEHERSQILNKAREFNQHLEKALIGHYNAEITVENFRNALGERVPFRPDLVRSQSASPAIVRTSTPAVAAPLPQVRRTTSG